MQRQGLVQAFRQTAGRRLVPILQLMLERLEGGEGLVVLRTVVGALETLPPHRLLTLGQVTHHVLARVPLTPLHQGAVAEGLPHGRPEPLAAIDDHQKPLGNIEAPARRKDRRNGVNTCSFSVSVSTKPRHRLSPVIVMPSATTIVASAHVLPSSTRATTSSPERSRSWSSRSFVALA